MTSANSDGMQRHFWQSSQHAHAARLGCGTDAPSVKQAAFPSNSVDIAAGFWSVNSIAGL